MRARYDEDRDGYTLAIDRWECTVLLGLLQAMSEHLEHDRECARSAQASAFLRSQVAGMREEIAAARRVAHAHDFAAPVGAELKEQADEQ